MTTERLLLRPTKGGVAIEHVGAVIGHVTVELDAPASQAQISFAINPPHQRRRFAGEAVDAVVTALFEQEAVTRVVAQVDDSNTPAMSVIEPLGFRFEGIIRHAARVGDVMVDRAQFALVPFDRQLWLARPRTPPERIEFVELSHEISFFYSLLTTHRYQEEFVSPMRANFRHALLPEVINGTRAVPWYRGIEADGVPVGFIMLALATESAQFPYLWRLLIDRVHQRRGIGQRVIAMLIDMLRAEGHSRLELSWGEGPGSPAAFYRSLGFQPTGNLIGGEVEAALNL